MNGGVWQYASVCGIFSKDGLTLSGTWDQKSGRSWKPWLLLALRKAGW